MKTSLKVVLALTVITLTVASCWTRTSEKAETDTPTEEVKIDTSAIDGDSGRAVIDTLK
jgi:hypothetical protein